MIIGTRPAEHLKNSYDVLCVLDEHPDSTIREVAFYLSNNNNKTMSAFFRQRDAEYYLTTAKSTIMRLVNAGLVVSSSISCRRRRYVLTQDGRDWRDMCYAEAL